MRSSTSFISSSPVSPSASVFSIVLLRVPNRVYRLDTQTPAGTAVLSNREDKPTHARGHEQLFDTHNGSPCLMTLPRLPGVERFLERLCLHSVANKTRERATSVDHSDPLTLQFPEFARKTRLHLLTESGA